MATVQHTLNGFLFQSKREKEKNCTFSASSVRWAQSCTVARQLRRSTISNYEVHIEVQSLTTPNDTWRKWVKMHGKAMSGKRHASFTGAFTQCSSAVASKMELWRIAIARWTVWWCTEALISTIFSTRSTIVWRQIRKTLSSFISRNAAMRNWRATKTRRRARGGAVTFVIDFFFEWFLINFLASFIIPKTYFVCWLTANT